MKTNKKILGKINTQRCSVTLNVQYLAVEKHKIVVFRFVFLRIKPTLFVERK
jgi:hypothetical protein